MVLRPAWCAPHSRQGVAPAAVPHSQLVVRHGVAPRVAAPQQAVQLALHKDQVLAQHLQRLGGWVGGWAAGEAGREEPRRLLRRGATKDAGQAWPARAQQQQQQQAHLARDVAPEALDAGDELGPPAGKAQRTVSGCGCGVEASTQLNGK